jgi:hypothetical protein
MTPALQEYLAHRSFGEASGTGAPQPGISVREYENGEFRIRIVNERSGEMYVQVASITKPEERRYLNGVVAFLTKDDTSTRSTGQDAERLTEHHKAIASLFSASPEGEAQREHYLAWEREFATREQLRLATAASTAKAARGSWWKFW